MAIQYILPWEKEKMCPCINVHKKSEDWEGECEDKSLEFRSVGFWANPPTQGDNIDTCERQHRHTCENQTIRTPCFQRHVWPQVHQQLLLEGCYQAVDGMMYWWNDGTNCKKGYNQTISFSHTFPCVVVGACDSLTGRVKGRPRNLEIVP